MGLKSDPVTASVPVRSGILIAYIIVEALHKNDRYCLTIHCAFLRITSRYSFNWPSKARKPNSASSISIIRSIVPRFISAKSANSSCVRVRKPA